MHQKIKLYVSVNQAIIGSNNGLSDWHQAIIWTNAVLLSVRPAGTNFNEALL